MNLNTSFELTGQIKVTILLDHHKLHLFLSQICNYMRFINLRNAVSLFLNTESMDCFEYRLKDS